MQQQWRRSGEMKDRMKLSLPQKIDGFMQQKWRRSGEMKDSMKLSLPQKLMVFLMLLILRFCWFILNLTLFYDQTQGSDAVFSILYG